MKDEQIYKCIAALQFPSVPERQPHGKGSRCRCRGRPNKAYLHILSLLPVATSNRFFGRTGKAASLPPCARIALPALPKKRTFANGRKGSPTANPKPNDKSAGNGPKQQTGNLRIGDSTRENPTVPAVSLRERFRAAESTPCCYCKVTKNDDTKLWLWQLYHYPGRAVVFGMIKPCVGRVFYFFVLQRLAKYADINLNICQENYKAISERADLFREASRHI